MIGELTGILTTKSSNLLILDVHGVGYEVMISARTFKSLPEPGEPLMLSVHTHVTEGAITLIGFINHNDKALFKKLIGVSGIGPRLAIQILSGMESADLVHAILQENLVMLTQINGIGKKTAERLIVELKDKLVAFLDPLKLGGRSFSSRSTNYDQAISALMNLGYTRPIAEKALQTIPIKPDSTMEEILKGSLGVLGR